MIDVTKRRIHKTSVLNMETARVSQVQNIAHLKAKEIKTLTKAGQIMSVETVQQLLKMTRLLHTNLANSLEKASLSTKNEKVLMLLDYLSLHEKELSRVLALSEQDAQSAAIHTWCIEYFDKHAIALDNIDYSNMTFAEIMRSIVTIHNKIIELYRYLALRAESVVANELLNNLLTLEQHEAMRIVRDAQELEDL